MSQTIKWAMHYPTIRYFINHPYISMLRVDSYANNNNNFWLSLLDISIFWLDVMETSLHYRLFIWKTLRYRPVVPHNPSNMDIWWFLCCYTTWQDIRHGREIRYFWFHNKWIDNGWYEFQVYETEETDPRADLLALRGRWTKTCILQNALHIFGTLYKMHFLVHCNLTVRMVRKPQSYFSSNMNIYEDTARGKISTVL